MTLEELKEYTRKFRYLSWFICVAPLGGWFLRGHWNYLFPIVDGNHANFFAVTLAMILASIGAILPLGCKITKARLPRILRVCSALIVCSAVIYFALNIRYVICIPLTNGNTPCVSIGWTRSEAAKEYARESCPQCSDIELLMAAGPYEDQVHQLWTESSIFFVRLGLFISYALILASLNFVIGALAK
jgi:hypothetical protein